MRNGVEGFIKKYKPTLTVDNFHSKGLKFKDELDQTVVVVPVRMQNGYFFFTKANADIFVLLKDSMMLGWAHTSSLIDAGNEYMMPSGSLNKMPSKLKFAQDCPHISYFGGVRQSTDKYMTCLGCGKEIV